MSQEFGHRHSYFGACNARTTATTSPETATKANQAVRTEFGMLKSNTRSSDHVPLPMMATVAVATASGIAIQPSGLLLGSEQLDRFVHPRVGELPGLPKYSKPRSTSVPARGKRELQPGRVDDFAGALAPEQLSFEKVARTADICGRFSHP